MPVQLMPRLIDVARPERPVGVVIVLHGGASRRGNMMGTSGTGPISRIAAGESWIRL
ncbi:MAG: hypothetical protein NVSMB25_23220 [Thermoleophilaceae bacterium]